MNRRITRPRVDAAELARDRAFWRDLLARREQSAALPQRTAGGYRNRRFAIIRNAAWITLYRSIGPPPQIGVFLRCRGPAGDAFLALADRARRDIEPRLRAAAGPHAALAWRACEHRGMTDVAATIAAPLPWDDAAAASHIGWLLQAGAAWWNAFTALADGS